MNNGNVFEAKIGNFTHRIVPGKYFFILLPNALAFK
jgi:hypothetical protein